MCEIVSVFARDWSTTVGSTISFLVSSHPSCFYYVLVLFLIQTIYLIFFLLFIPLLLPFNTTRSALAPRREPRLNWDINAPSWRVPRRRELFQFQERRRRRVVVTVVWWWMPRRSRHPPWPRLVTCLPSWWTRSMI
jgi:hypothetical protein